MIRNIIFDLGNVLVKVDYTKFKHRLAKDGVTDEMYNEFFGTRTGFRKYYGMGYESGLISTTEFVSKCREGLNLKMEHDEYCDVFNDMFIEIEPMKRVVNQLAKDGKYNLFLLSNTSPLHFEYVKSNFDFVNRLHKFGLSYELKSLKPDEMIFTRALGLFNAKPEESLFIDDLADNCIAAEKLGMRSIIYDQCRHEDFEISFRNLVRENS